MNTMASPWCHHVHSHLSQMTPSEGNQDIAVVKNMVVELMVNVYTTKSSDTY